MRSESSIQERIIALRFSNFCRKHNPPIIYREQINGELGYDGIIELTTKDIDGKIQPSGILIGIVVKNSKNLAKSYQPSFHLKRSHFDHLKSIDLPVLLVAYHSSFKRMSAKNIDTLDTDPESDKYVRVLFSANEELTKDVNLLDHQLNEIYKNKIQKYNLIYRLENCDCGKDQWREYENICAGIVEFLFQKSFRNLAIEIQAKNAIGSDIKDLILPNRSVDPFWKEIRTDYSARNIVFEFKNNCKEIGKDQLVQVSNYLKKKTLGRFAIIFTRTGLNKNGKEIQFELLRDDDKMIIVLNDKDLINLIILKKDDKRPEEILELLKTKLELNI